MFSPLISIALAFLALLIGPLAGIWVDRTVAREGIAFGHRCVTCQSPLGVRSLIPVVHWFQTCPSCEKAKGIRYLLVDIALVLSVAVMLYSVDQLRVLPIYLVAAFFWSVLSVIDIETHLLPNVIVWPLTIATAIALALIGFDMTNLVSALVGALVFSGLLFLSFVVYPKGMGLGDVKLALSLGLLLGWLQEGAIEAVLGSLWALVLSLLAGGLGGLVFNFLAKRGRSEIPFGPFLIAGTLVVILVT